MNIEIKIENMELVGVEIEIIIEETKVGNRRDKDGKRRNMGKREM